MLPWVWIIPLNQYFWDDWLWSHNTDFTWHLEYWLFDGAKHFVDPFIYPILISLGAWSFGVLTSLATFATAWTISKIVETQTWVPSITKKWIGPFILVLPVFHSRFSAATLEYSLSLAALFVAWWVTVSRGYVGRFLVAVPLLILAIGVPSLAVLYPLIYLHVVLGECSLVNSRYLFRTFVKNSYIVIIPGLFAIVFSTYFNREGKYEASFGATVEFFRGLIILLIAAALILTALMRSKRTHSRDSILVVSSGVAAYLGFFPYFAVGYNPLSDFLPWRIRSEVMTGLATRITTTLIVLSVIAVLASLFFRLKDNGIHIMRSAILLCVPVLFATAVVTLGPMDWESRHWLIAWPPLALFFIAIVGLASHKVQTALVKTIFIIFLVASLTISSEYFIDSIKQKSIVSAVASELSAERLGTSDVDEILVVVATVESTNRLNARFRTYRPYEWWGLVSRGLSIDPRRLKIMEPSDATSRGPGMCNPKYVATRISPEVESGRFEALLKFSVRVSLNPEPLLLCSDQVRDGYPKDR